ncbi:MAG: universal stress protein [Terriglobales bacterium]
METIEVKQAVSFKKILVATDFSAVSKAALKYAAGIASRHGSKVYLTHVIPPVPRSFIPIEPVPPELDTDRADADRDMKSFVAGTPLEHVDHELLLERGPTRSVLAELIRQNEIDLLVLGTHGRTGIKKLALGSVAEELFRLAACPVLTVGPEVPADPKDAGQVHRILFATDFGVASLSALPHAVALAQEDKAKLILLHILSPIPPLDSGPYWYSRTDLFEQREPERHKTLERLAELVAESGLSCAPECLAPFGFVPQGILNVAAEQKADLIVMGVKYATFGRGSSHMSWTIAHEVVCRAKCPVLTVRN